MSGESDASRYEPAERLYLWLVVRPERPLPVGQIALVRSLQGLSLLEYLYFAGDDRFGALGVSTSADAYRPRRMGPLPTLEEADELHELIRKIENNEPVPPEQRRLISPGATMPVRLTHGHAVAVRRFDRRGALRAHSISARGVARVVEGWKEHFAACGVAEGDIELYAEQIDRPFLRDQRRAIASARGRG